MFSATGDHNESEPSTSSSSSIESSQPCRHFEFPEILLATNNFEESLVIGRGGFGKVYKGNITHGSSVVVAAIKRLDPMSNQGASEFWAEIKMLSNFRHCHLVSLFGYCNYEEEMILVYEYMPNRTLDDHLHKLDTTLPWLQRLKICIGAARGLDYLHTGTGINVGVIHRDVKSSNILLDESWAAKISDFGLSKTGPTNQPLTYVNTRVKGTFGYLDPDYSFTGMLTRKSDVYAFGVVLLELLCRKPAVDWSLGEEPRNVARWVQESIKEGNLKHIIDSSIRGEISPKCLKEFVRIAERCLHLNPKQRPMMAEVVVSLNFVLILQEKTNTSLQGAGKTVFEKMLGMFPSSSKGENSAHDDSKLSRNSNVNGKKAGDTIRADDMDFTIPTPSLKEFNFADLKRVTRHFRQGLILRIDDYGEVYLGWLDKNTLTPSTEGLGIAVAIRRCRTHPRWETMPCLAHPNIIRLLGGCDDIHRNLLLFYEHVQMQNFGDFLFKDVGAPLSWETRVTIMMGVARGLAYLHNNLVVHCDVQSSNIFLDQDFNAKVGNFEFERYDPQNATTDTCVPTDTTDTSVAGAYGYADPTFWEGGDLSAKNDIYSFGVVLLETLTGHRVVDRFRPRFNLIEWAGPSLASRTKLKKIMDPRLEQNYPLNGAFEFAALALRCITTDLKDRPSSMEDVLQCLEQINTGNK